VIAIDHYETTQKNTEKNTGTPYQLIQDRDSILLFSREQLGTLPYFSGCCHSFFFNRLNYGYAFSKK
jgi:hypothetical protein